MKTILTILLLSTLTASAQLDPLYQHQLYKVEYGDQFAPDSVKVNGTSFVLGFFLSGFGTTTSAPDMFNADVPFMLDLNSDGVVNVTDLMLFLENYGDVIWNQAQFGCSSLVTNYACWLSYYPDMQVLSIMNLPAEPIKMIRTSNPDANWWWYASQ